MAPTNLPLRLVKKLTFRSARSNVQQFFDETTRSWNEESFSKFLGIKHPEIAISKDLVHLLWKIFQYYAHHPFAPKSSEETIDANGFRRAILLLHLRRTERLGTLEYDYHWKMQNESIMNGNVERVFRIIGQPYIKTNLNDVMDVLASVQPTLSFCELPSPGQVEATARRLICKESTQPPFQIARKDITSLMSLLLRMKVSKTKPKTLSPQGYFEPADSTHDEMAQILVNKMIGREVDFLQSDQINQSLTSLV
ncbi:hypothetical protein N7456_009481 [Penicillium angulare]|uniref:Uncharacterized protein n=1 Tax=Penicillium angulare TaxID=116970 RepID=A0A9W9F4Q3_9EURO|nr:hypothetical protein N7456_009481 [Penicillium angulare]